MPDGIKNVATARPMRETDLDDVVRVHISAFSSFFLTFLGARFLREFYSFALFDQPGIAFVAEKENRVVGLVVGSTEPAGFYRRAIRSRWFAFALASLPALTRKPSILMRLVRNFSKPKKAQEVSPDCELMSIAVSPGDAGRGIGRVLLDAFCSRAFAQGARCISLTTDSDNNHSVNRFYINNGFVLRRALTTPEGRRMNIYEKTAFGDCPTSGSER